MYCPTCQLALVETVESCPTCGDAVRPLAPDDPVLSVESVAHGESLVGAAQVSSLGEAAEPDGESLLPVVSRRGDLRVIPRLPQLTALAWREPRVRAAVKTGAGAIALSLAMRAASRMLTDRRSRAVATRAATSLIGERLRPPSQRDPGVRPEGGGEIFEIVETYISVRHVRRVVRR
jgi:hypothetical protein